MKFINADLSRRPNPGSERITSAITPIKQRVFAEVTARSRARAPTETHWKSYGNALDVILANVVLGRGRVMLFPMSKDAPTRYVEVRADALQTVLKAMERLRMIRVVRQGSNGPNANRRNEIHPGRGLCQALAHCDRSDLETSKSSEVVRLKDGTEAGKLLDYRDDPYTDVNRALLGILARHIAGRIQVGDHQGREQLRRSFTFEFDKNGRLGGHWAMNVESGERHRMTIDGLPVVQVDYQASTARLLFAKYGQVAPEGDLFAFEGLDRDAVKTVFYAMLHRRKARNAYPENTRHLFPQDMPFHKVQAMLFARFPMLEQEIHLSNGLRIMKTESDVLMAAMLMQYADGVPFLPLHDALLVPAPATGRTQYNMVRAFKAVAQVDLPMSCHPLAKAYSQGGYDLIQNPFGPVRPLVAAGQPVDPLGWVAGQLSPAVA